CWLHLHHLETIYSAKDSMSLDLGSYYQRCITSAQKRYLAAIKTLALERKLAVPVMQVDIASEPVDVAGPCVAADSDGGTPGNARAAAEAGCGRGEDATGLAEGKRCGDQAREWLRAELAARARALDADLMAARGGVREALTRWRAEPDLACVREPGEL